MKYYKIQEGSKEVNGFPIRVHPNSKLEERIKVLHGSLDCRIIKFHKNNAEYLVNLNNNPIGRRKLIGIMLSKEGNLTLSNVPKNCKIYLTKISRKEARELAEDNEYGNLIQGYCDGNID